MFVKALLHRQIGFKALCVACLFLFYTSFIVGGYALLCGLTGALFSPSAETFPAKLYLSASLQAGIICILTGAAYHILRTLSDLRNYFTKR